MNISGYSTEKSARGCSLEFGVGAPKLDSLGLGSQQNRIKGNGGCKKSEFWGGDAPKNSEFIDKGSKSSHFAPPPNF